MQEEKKVERMFPSLNNNKRNSTQSQKLEHKVSNEASTERNLTSLNSNSQEQKIKKQQVKLPQISDSNEEYYKKEIEKEENKLE